ncbi:type IV secretion system protein [Variovorax sp. KK3]|uniref:type IV secretion system protein n=1 Tax=Variovorax sp. KK3 TaxID=1855728 RepID=UPI001C4DF6D8|nr:type IV secretion system protein [Variovorax sp. KK3]
MSAAGASAQIPVTDIASLTQQVQQVMSWTQQYKQMIDSLKNQKEQIDNQVRQIQSLTGGRGMANLAGNMLRQELPADFLTRYDQLRSLGAGGASSGAKAIYEQIRTFDCAQRYPGNQRDRMNCEATAMAIPQNLDLINGSLNSAKQRQSQLRQLGAAIDTSDAKAAADLSNRMSLEIAYLQNEKMMMDMALQQQQQQLALSQQRTAEEGAKRLTRSNGGGANPFNLD